MKRDQHKKHVKIAVKVLSSIIGSALGKLIFEFLKFYLF